MPPAWLSDHLKILRPVGLPPDTSCNDMVLKRDVSCRVNNYTLGTEAAHLLPKSEELWFTNNSMLQYSAWEEKGTTDDPRNTLFLRSDVHTLFDAKRFVIAPKQGKWTTYVLQGAAQDELARNFHSIQMQPLTYIAVELLFARFVYAIHSVSGFTLGGGKCTLLVATTDQGRKRIEITGRQYKSQLAPRSRTGSRTSSPRKRSHADMAATEDVGNVDDASQSSADEG